MKNNYDGPNNRAFAAKSREDEMKLPDFDNPFPLLGGLTPAERTREQCIGIALACAREARRMAIDPVPGETAADALRRLADKLESASISLKEI